MSIAEGSRTYFAIKEEAVANTEESGSGGQILRRVTGQLSLTKPEITSAEKRTDFQDVNVSHGTRSVNFNIQGPLLGGDYAVYVAATLRKALTAISNITASMTIASGVVSRASGSFLSDGLKVGLIGRFGAMTTTGNLGRNARVSAVAADGSTFTAHFVDGGDPIADDSGTNASATFTIPGKVSYIPSSAHTSKTFTIEKYDGANDVSQIGRGNKFGSFEVSVQPDQEPTITFDGLGIDRRNVASGSSPVLTSPTAVGTGPTMAAAVGYLRVNGVAQAVVTGFTLKVDNGLSNLPVAFANVSPDVFYGRASQVTGQITLARTGNAISDLFDDETEVSLELYSAAPGSDPNAFLSFYLPRVKINSDDEDDPDGPSIITASFRALKKTSGTGHELTTIIFQDSSAA